MSLHTWRDCAGATIVVTPEQGALTKDDIVDMARRLERAILGGQRQPIVLVAEGVGLDAALVASGDSHPTVRLAHELAAYFRRHASLVSNLDVRASIPGHLLRASCRRPQTVSSPGDLPSLRGRLSPAPESRVASWDYATD